jgi:hypothetical protein
MQTLIHVSCKKGKSIRDLIAKDGRRLTDFDLTVSEQKRSTRARGWTKIHGTIPDRQGAINIVWDNDAHMLICRVVNRGAGRPAPIVGSFVEYLLQRFSRRIRVISVLPG